MGCSTQKLYVKNNEIICTGWKKINYTNDTAVYLSYKDTQAAKDILYHNKFGKKIGCWK